MNWEDKVKVKCTYEVEWNVYDEWMNDKVNSSIEEAKRIIRSELKYDSISEEDFTYEVTGENDDKDL